MSYAPDHASALADLRAAGTAVTFTRTTNAYDEATGLLTPTTATVTGYAIRDMGRPDRYERLGLVPGTNPTLQVTTTTYGAAILLGDTVTWGGTVLTVKDVEPVDLDGNGAVIASVVAGA